MGRTDSTEYIDWDQAEDVLLPKLKPSAETISRRLPESMLDEIRLLANKRDVPYQSLIKILLKERVDPSGDRDTGLIQGGVLGARLI